MLIDAGRIEEIRQDIKGLTVYPREGLLNIGDVEGLLSEIDALKLENRQLRKMAVRLDDDICELRAHYATESEARS